MRATFRCFINGYMTDAGCFSVQPIIFFPFPMWNPCQMASFIENLPLVGPTTTTGRRFARRESVDPGAVMQLRLIETDPRDALKRAARGRRELNPINGPGSLR